MRERTVWSYSRLSAYNTCPYQYRAKYITKEIEFKPTEATMWGTAVHEAAEAKINGGATDAKFDFLNPYIKSIGLHVLGHPTPYVMGGQVSAEHEVAITEQDTPTTFDDPNAFIRGRIDVLVRDGNRAQILDWKTNKKTSAALMPELECFSWMLMTMHPEIEMVNNVLIWLTTKDKPTTKMLKRSDLPELEDKFLENIGEIEASMTFDKFAKKRSGLCRNHCPVTSCSNNGK